MQKQPVKNGPTRTAGIPGIEAIEQICIVGRNLFQNQLIKSFLELEISFPCPITTAGEWDSATSVMQSNARPLALWDCFGISPGDIWTKMGLGGGPDPRSQAIALFNVEPDPGRDFEFAAVERSIRGIFYLNETPDVLAKGIGRILNGELWYSRKTTSQILMDRRRFRPRDEALEAMLTVREKQILISIASGATNSEVAETFSISLHTVKTHIYNVYKKIDVHNRLEATLWVARYL